ncbi:uncharacterized protein HD556DRAFT_1528614 [Suillus plorans]|uniref:Uncharacterized protein n=1 Tax=Suillus plorans TaxID=116603 RepID=A0A9P7DG02_9AGAM|nr:uncharacterized protein HD556DRAFT_1528614 [Suillus plorans]KAG1791067.1 hypothetical protein HD556DRAFT_1528614 [Suillus plorans]
MAMRLEVRRKQVNLRLCRGHKHLNDARRKRNQVHLWLCQGHKCLKGNQQERKAQVAGREFLVKLGVVDCFLVVVVLPRISHEVIYKLVAFSLDFESFANCFAPGRTRWILLVRAV